MFRGYLNDDERYAQVLPRRLVPVGRPREARRRRLLLVRRPRRRRDQGGGPPDRPVRGRERADGAPGRVARPASSACPIRSPARSSRRSSRSRPATPPSEALRTDYPRARAPAAGPPWRRARSRSSSSCRGRAAARSCGVCCAPASSACPRGTCPRWRARHERTAGRDRPASAACTCSRADAAHPAVRGAVRGALRRRQDPRLPPPLHGEEAVAVGVMQVLGRGRRGRRRPTASTGTRSRAAFRMGPLMAEMYGKRTAAAAGAAARCTSSTRRRASTAATRSSAAACRSRSGWRSPRRCAAARVAACFFGEGAAAEGEFHESMNLAALWQLPVLFLCENNLYAMGTALARSESETDIHAKAAAYGVRAVAVDGMDVFAVEAATRDAADSRGRARARACSSCAPTGSARTRCSTRSSIATRRRSRSGASAGRSSRSRRRLKAAGLMTEEDFQRIERGGRRRGRGRGRFRRAVGLGAGRGPRRVTSTRRRRAR